MSPSKSAITQRGWGLYTLRVGIDPGDLRFRLRVGVIEIWRFLTRGWELVLPGCGGTSALAQGATLAARWIHEPQPISNHLVGLGFPHPAGRYRPGGPAFSTSGSWSCRDRERFMIRGWELILSGCGGISALSRGATLAARWLHEPQPICNQPVGLRVSTPCGVVSTGGISVFVPGLLEL